MKSKGTLSEDRDTGAKIGMGYWIYEPRAKNEPAHISAYKIDDPDARSAALRDLTRALAGTEAP